MLAAVLLAVVSGAEARVSSREYLEQQLVQSSDFRNRTQAALALGRLADPRSRPALERALESDSNPAVRAAAAVSLGKLGDRRAIAALRRAERDDSASVRRQAESAIAELRGEATPAPDAAPRPIDWRRVRHVVAIGQVSNNSSVGGATLVAPLRQGVLAGLGGVAGVAPFGDANDIGAEATQQIARRRIPRFRVDAVLSDVQRTERQGELRLRCSVNLTIYEEPSRNVLGMLSGSATAAEPMGQGRDQELRMTTAALNAAVRSALTTAGSAFERAGGRR
ncbi:MAG: HEAT repeat domain-containing protein [Myxococcales bacterium]|nr:HEAT repeat domain-containing protein [Myxococcales bacterium]MCB9628286.1 HEAT repeat domain-containing protein [Sandaracinaceae bacterium]